MDKLREVLQGKQVVMSWEIVKILPSVSPHRRLSDLKDQGWTITFKLYGPSDTGCGALVFTSSTVPVSGNGTYNAPSFTPTAPGNYHWVAVYSGSSPNTSAVTHNAACTDTDEDVTVSDVPSSISTAQRWVPNDSATVSAPAGGNLSGTVHLAL